MASWWVEVFAMNLLAGLVALIPLAGFLGLAAAAWYLFGIPFQSVAQFFIVVLLAIIAFYVRGIHHRG